MTKSEALKRSIEIAVERGYKPKCKASYTNYESEGFASREFKVHQYQNNSLHTYIEFIVNLTGGWLEHCYSVIFDHQFCNALFGEKKEEWLGKFVWYSFYEQDSEIFKDYKEVISSWIFYTEDSKPTIHELNSLSEDGLEVAAGKLIKHIEITNQGWQYHLTKMVLYEDPLDYLVEYLGKEKA